MPRRRREVDERAEYRQRHVCQRRCGVLHSPADHRRVLGGRHAGKSGDLAPIADGALAEARARIGRPGREQAPRNAASRPMRGPAVYY